jgi:hypothetical protein
MHPELNEIGVSPLFQKNTMPSPEMVTVGGIKMSKF